MIYKIDVRDASVDNAQFGLTSAVHDHSSSSRLPGCFVTSRWKPAAIPSRNFYQHPKNIPIAINCPKNKWLISCKELLPKISTCFIHAVLLPPKLPTVETQKKQATRTEISMIHKQASRRCVCMTWALLPSWNLANCVQDFQVCLWWRLRDVPPVEWISGTKSDGVREQKAKHISKYEMIPCTSSVGASSSRF